MFRKDSRRTPRCQPVAALAQFSQLREMVNGQGIDMGLATGNGVLARRPEPNRRSFPAIAFWPVAAGRCGTILDPASALARQGAAARQDIVTKLLAQGQDAPQISRLEKVLA
jgi:hypothetical protein